MTCPETHPGSWMLMMLRRCLKWDIHYMIHHDIYIYITIYPIGSMYAIYGNIYHQYTPNVSIYIPYMDPMGIYIYLLYIYIYYIIYYVL